jgi:hypothetical protein
MNRKCCLLQFSGIEVRNMGDSNPRSGDWDNNMKGIYVAGAVIILLALAIVWLFS